MHRWVWKSERVEFNIFFEWCTLNLWQHSKLHLQCAAASCLSYSLSSRHLEMQEGGASLPLDLLPCSWCGKSSSHPCFWGMGRRHDTGAPESHRCSSGWRPSSEESWELTVNKITKQLRKKTTRHRNNSHQGVRTNELIDSKYLANASLYTNTFLRPD